MRAREFITEARGLFGRTTGDAFIKDGLQYDFQQITTYPADGTDQFIDAEARDNGVFEVTEELDSEIMWVNNPNNGMLAFGIAELLDADGNPIYWGKYFKAIKPNMFNAWQNTNLPVGFKFGSMGAAKSQANLSPQDLIKTEQEFTQTEQIVSIVGSNADDKDAETLVFALEQLQHGDTNVTFDGMADDTLALRDYFSEIMQPVALFGKAVTGQAEDARTELAGGAEWSDCTIRFPMASNEPMIDSIVTAPNGQEIGISTKGGKGADASIKNIYDAVQKAEDLGNEELIASARYTIDIVNIINDNSAIQGPAEVGKYLKIPGVTNKVQTEIEEYIASGKQDLDGISDNATKLFNLANARDGYYTGYAILTGLSKLVASTINGNSDFSKGGLALLNQSAIIQIYTTVKKTGKDAQLVSFRAVYPPVFDGHLIVNGSKNYMSTTNKGKLAFGFGSAEQLSKAAAMPGSSPVTPKAKKLKPGDALDATRISAKDGGVVKEPWLA